MASSLQTGLICWVAGPYACGKWPDIRIFRRDLKHALPHDEMIHADRGYTNHPGTYQFFTPNEPGTRSEHEANGRAQARHEKINRTLKKFKCLDHKFRHPLEKHGMCFRAVAVLVQATMTFDEMPFDIVYEE